MDGQEGDRMKVYVAELGCYSDRYIQGVYDSPERAMGALGGDKWTHHVHYGFHSWGNDLDSSESAWITEEEIVDTGPIRDADEERSPTDRKATDHAG